MSKSAETSSEAKYQVILVIWVLPKAKLVNDVFNSVAPSYDIMNDLMS